MITILSILAIIAYITTFVLIVVRFRGQLHHTQHKSTVFLKLAWGAGILLHALILYTTFMQVGSVNFGLTSVISHVSWLISLLLFYTIFKCKIETLGLFIIPMVVISIALPLLVPETIDEVHFSGGLGFHILISLLAYSVLMFATVQSLLLAHQNRNLHKRKTSGLISTLPALQDMEALLFRLIKLGVILLTVAILSGVVFLDGSFQRGLIHKTVFSIVAWLVFSALLYGHIRYGWRGRVAVRWTLIGSTFLLLAFFGSKFVLEYLIT